TSQWPLPDMLSFHAGSASMLCSAPRPGEEPMSAGMRFGLASPLDTCLLSRPNSAKNRERPMPIIDSQVHAYEANTPKRPWDTVPNWPAHVTGEEMVAEMDKVGVDGAIFISAFSQYRYDASYAVEVQRAHPGR